MNGQCCTDWAACFKGAGVEILRRLRLHPKKEYKPVKILKTAKRKQNTLFKTISLFFSIPYFEIFSIYFWPPVEVSLSALRFYSIHSDTACPQSFTL